MRYLLMMSRAAGRRGRAARVAVVSSGRFLPRSTVRDLAGCGERASCEGDDGNAGNPGHLGEIVLGTSYVVTVVHEQTAVCSYVFIGDV